MIAPLFLCWLVRLECEGLGRHGRAAWDCRRASLGRIPKSRPRPAAESETLTQPNSCVCAFLCMCVCVCAGNVGRAGGVGNSAVQRRLRRSWVFFFWLRNAGLCSHILCITLPLKNTSFASHFLCITLLISPHGVKRIYICIYKHICVRVLLHFVG